MSFKIDQKIICVELPTNKMLPGESLPVVNEIYTIREITEHWGNIYFRLNELVNPVLDYKSFGFMECWFISEYFRPIDYSYGEKVAEEITEACEKESFETVNQEV